MAFYCVDQLDMPWRRFDREWPLRTMPEEDDRTMGIQIGGMILSPSMYTYAAVTRLDAVLFSPGIY